MICRSDEIKPCPFCGGKGKVSFRDYRYVGHNARGDRKIDYRVQVICNKCRSRGKPIITDGLVNPSPYVSKWGNVYAEASPVCQRETEKFAPYVCKAIDAWNRRANDGKQ